MRGEKRQGGERWGWVIRSDADDDNDEERYGGGRGGGGGGDDYKREGRGHIKEKEPHAFKAWGPS